MGRKGPRGKEAPGRGNSESSRDPWMPPVPRRRVLLHCPLVRARGASGSLSAGTALGTRRILSAVEDGLKLKLVPEAPVRGERGAEPVVWA